MRLSLKRATAGAASLALTASLVLQAGPVAAAPSLQGAAEIRTPGGGAALTSGTTATNFTLRLPSGAACGGDASAGYRVQGYMVAEAIDPSTLTFDTEGPLPQQFGSPQNTFRQPLYDTSFSPYVGFPAAATPPSTLGSIINIPDFTYQVFGPGNIPAGAYNVGIACINGNVAPNPIEEYWNVKVTFSSNGGDGFANMDWSKGAVAAAPVLDSVTPGNTECTASFTPGLSDPAATSYTASATPSGGGASVQQAGAGSPITISGLTNGTTYDVVVTATNTVGTSAPSNTVQCTPVAGPRNNVTDLTATPGAPGSGQVTLSWTEPAANTPPASPVSYDVDWTGGGTASVPAPATGHLVIGLAPGVYTFTVVAIYADAPTEGTPLAQAVASVNAAQVLMGEVDVTRPTGALVLTQVCNSHGLIPSESASAGFPDGLGEEAAVDGSLVGAPTTGGSGPYLDPALTTPDPDRGEYPYPTDDEGVPNAAYPTHCGLDLGTAEFVTVGDGAGQFFAASGILDQITVVDTTDADLGWDVTGTMSDFDNGAGDIFSGSQLGWTPQMTDDTEPFTDSMGNPYNQTVVAGGPVAPNTGAATGLSSGATLASAAAGEGLGIAILDARLKLLIPVTADSGDYEGTLSITSV